MASQRKTATPGNTREDTLRKRFTNRRRMAWFSFINIMILGGGMVGYGLSSDAAAARVQTMSGPVGIILGVFVSVVLAWFGSSAYEHSKTEIKR